MGHRIKREGFMREGFGATPKGEGFEEDDTEGHSMLPNMGVSRGIAAARERDIQQHLKRHELETDARAHKKDQR